MKPSINKQIEAVKCVHKGYHFNDEIQDALAAAIETLRGIKKPKVAPMRRRK